jgi:hypothetical protein
MQTETAANLLVRESELDRHAQLLGETLGSMEDATRMAARSAFIAGVGYTGVYRVVAEPRTLDGEIHEGFVQASRGQGGIGSPDHFREKYIRRFLEGSL